MPSPTRGEGASINTEIRQIRANRITQQSAPP
jgi:hypothetical protein